MHDFAALQAWMQNALLTDNAEGARDRIVESNRLTAADRIGIYARGYALRLIECLRAEYPVLRRWVGEQVFDLFAFGYIRAHNSDSYTLYDYGAGFADHLAACRPPDAGADSAEAALSALARVERARATATRAYGVERDPPASAVDAVSALLLQPDGRYELPDSVRLLRCDFDVSAMFKALEDDQDPQTPPYAATPIIVARRRYRVQVHKPDPVLMAWLEALGEAGGDLRAAATLAAERLGEPLGRVLAELCVRLPSATDMGMVRKTG
jgi:hypothetical protein